MSTVQNNRQLAPRHTTDIVSDDGEVIDQLVGPSALESITRAEIDIQVATANRYPRSITKFISEAKSIVALDPDLAAQCTYRLPARRGSTEVISGPSVRLAEICASSYRNLRISGRITDDDGKMITAQAVAMDLERNVGYSVEVKRGVVTREGRRYGDDMIKTTCQAAIAIAVRNATFKVIPRAFVSVIEDEAQRVATGDIKTLPERTSAALAWFAGKGVKEDRVFAALGIGGASDMTLDRLQTLHGYRAAVKEGVTTLDEIFAPPKAPDAVAGPTGNKSADLAAKLGGGKPAQGGANVIPPVDKNEGGSAG